MIIEKRDTLKMLVGSLIATAFSTRSTGNLTAGTVAVTTQFPPVELQGEHPLLAGLAADIAGFSVVRDGEPAFAVWLEDKDGHASLVRVDQRDVSPKFEVFTLSIASAAELATEWKNWRPPSVPEGASESLGTLMTTHPAAPVPPKKFNPWPFTVWRTDVLKRAEFIVEDALIQGTVGSNPNMKSAARPMSVPREASATCQVVAGILFTGSNGERLLMGVDWMPMNMVVTEKAAEIDAYLEPCEAIELSAYLKRISQPN